MRCHACWAKVKVKDHGHKHAISISVYDLKSLYAKYEPLHDKTNKPSAQSVQGLGCLHEEILGP